MKPFLQKFFEKDIRTPKLAVKRKTFLLGWLLLATPAAVQAQFTYTITNQTVTITLYTATNLVVAIPSTIDGLPVTAIGPWAFSLTSIQSVMIPDTVATIGDGAFHSCTGLTSITIPNSITSIGNGAFDQDTSLTNVAIGNGTTNIGENAFEECLSLTSVTIPNSITSIGDWAFSYCLLTSVTIPNSVTSIGGAAFYGCTSLTNVTIGNSVTSIGGAAFASCASLTNLTIPNSVTSIGGFAFGDCFSLTSLYFEGNAPSLSGTNVFDGDNVTLYYLPGTTGWGSIFAGLPTAVWTLPYPLILTSTPSFGVQTNRFGFTVSWATNLNVVVEAATDLVNSTWSPVQTNALTTGSFYFSDPLWTNFPSRFYRLRSQ